MIKKFKEIFEKSFKSSGTPESPKSITPKSTIMMLDPFDPILSNNVDWGKQISFPNMDLIENGDGTQIYS